MSDRMESSTWVEIIEPRTKEHMYANLTTGECVWDPPEDVPIKRTDSSQWWELFDTNTQRFYYYNAATQKTVWHRPSKCDIIPLAKLQTLKQNTDQNDRIENNSQTQQLQMRSPSSATGKLRTQRSGGCGGAALNVNKRTGDCQYGSSEEKLGVVELISSPGRGRQNLRFGTGDSARSMDMQHNSSRRSQDYCSHYKESGKSSDSSLSSVHGYRRFNEANIVTGENIRLGSLQKQNRSRKDGVGFDILLQESASSHNLPHASESTNSSGDKFYENQLLPTHLQGYYSPKCCEAVSSPTHSMHTPQPKKRISPDAAQHMQQPFSYTNQHKHQQNQQQCNVAAQQNLDFVADEKREYKVSLARSGSFMSSSINPASAAHHSKSYRKSSGEANGGAASDDSMHEKYFKSVENTPLARRRNTSNTKNSISGANNSVSSGSNKKHSSESASPPSPISPQTNSKPKTKSSNNAIHSHLAAPHHAPGNTTGASPSQLPQNRKQDTSPCNLEILNMERISLNMKPTSPTHFQDVANATTAASVSPNMALKNFPSADNVGMSSRSKQKSVTTSGGGQHQQQQRGGSLRQNSSSLDKQQRHSNESRYKRDSRKVKQQPQRQQHLTADNGSDLEFDNGNISPLYSNWDQEMQDHLLPLKHYILEQAKLSGRYVLGEPIDSDVSHSDSQSEHSLSGHEPDNEDSDGGSDTHGGYLEHNYGIIDDYAHMGDSVSYYAYQYPPYDPSSDNVDIVLESIGGGASEQSQKPKSRYQVMNTEVGSATQTSTQQYNQHQLYSNAPSLPHSQQHPVAPPRQHLQLSADIDNYSGKQKQQSQTLPSPNRQIARIAQTITDVGGVTRLTNQPSHHYPKEDTSSHMMRAPPSLKPTIQQIFPPSERSPQALGGVPTLACMKECDIEKFAADNLNLHSKGIFRKKSSVRDMLSWTAEAISRPMLALSRDKAEKKIAIELFKLMQIYMGDRKARAGMSLNSVAIDIIVSALPQQQLRDELYVQVCRQTTENPKRESLIRGWELMAICLSFVPPSPTFQPTLLNYVNRHRDPSFATAFPEVGKWPIHVQISHYATVCCRRLARIGNHGRRQAKKPTEDEVEQARNQILRNSMFGNTLAEVMELQKDKFPFRKLPWIQTTLTEHVLLLNGQQTEGIFRVSADVDEVNCLKSRLDRWEVPDYKNTLADAHAPASLLKLWYRELYDPLIPDELYEECVNTDEAAKVKAIVERLPELNKLVLTYLIHFLQQFAHADVVTCTKMDSSNLAMVFAPNCLRCISDDPKVILENARKEMSFLRTLIQHMDTAHMANVV